MDLAREAGSDNCNLTSQFKTNVLGGKVKNPDVRRCWICLYKQTIPFKFRWETMNETRRAYLKK